MTQRDNILQELKELESSLVNSSTQNVYQLPAGYFDGLADRVLNRIRALNTEDAAEELRYLSPLLSGLSKQMPYTIPAGFFEGISERVIAGISDENKTPADELKELSPFLGGLKKEMPYSVPTNYFEQLEAPAKMVELRPVAKVIPIRKPNWFRYAAAAAVITFVAIGGFLLFNRNGSIDPRTQSAEWVIKNTKKISTDEINKFVQLADEESRDVVSVDVKSQVKEINDVQELIKDISEKDIENFLDDTKVESNNDEDVLMN